NVAFDDLSAVAQPALRHRIFLQFEAEADGMTADRLISEILEHTVKEPAKPWPGRRPYSWSPPCSAGWKAWRSRSAAPSADRWVASGAPAVAVSPSSSRIFAITPRATTFD